MIKKYLAQAPMKLQKRSSSNTPAASFWNSLRLRLQFPCAYATSVNIRYAYVYASAYAYVAL